MPSARIAVCSWSLPSDDPGSLPRHLAAAGLRAVQLALSPLVATNEAAAAAARLRQADIEIVSGMMAMAGEDYASLESIARTGGVRPDGTWSDNLAHAEMVAGCAADLGLELVTFHAGFLPEDPADPERATLLTRLRTIADVFAGRNVAIGFETGQETADTLTAVLDAIDRPNVGVNFDPANMILYAKGDPVEALRTLAPRVKQIHVKDAVATSVPGTWGTEVPAGRGDVDWPAFFEVAQTLDPPVDFVIEREAGSDRVDDIVAARDLVARSI